MIIRRDKYLNELIGWKHTDLIKIITGIRRCGKSFLLLTLFHQHLLETGTDESHIIEIALDDISNESLREPFRMVEYVKERIKDREQYYLIIDEVQLLDRFVDVLNSFMHIPNVDVYVTGSNSRFLSKDVATEFRGRGMEIHIYPLSFAELYAAEGGDKYALWKRYYTYGGLPYLALLSDDKKRAEYLTSLNKTLYLRDIVERNKVMNVEEFSELMNVMASGIGSPCNPNKIANTFKTVKKVCLTPHTIANYLSYMEDAFILEKSMRYDIKGRKYIGTLSKYYFQDIGLRNALLNFRQVEETHIMENVIYNELRSRGYSVDVGMVDARTATERKQLEVDFVANKGDKRYYIQSAFALPDEEKRQQEFASLKRINDSFKKVIIMREDIAPYHDDNGVLIMGLMDFLLKTDIDEIR
ncbi:MAG: ATP-binding protein [Prevotella sp.]|uniref:ATP-binding protein n=1 Tax=Bacteroides acidifaciens TaxID=85831 RepID=UPI0025B7538F|nr:ATP-binding protein [Bacteroides acidifaciens]MBS5528969.1 ATP-binding protein [Prevotella sp.]